MPIEGLKVQKKMKPATTHIVRSRTALRMPRHASRNSSRCDFAGASWMKATPMTSARKGKQAAMRKPACKRRCCAR